MSELPQNLHDVSGPIGADRAQRAAASLGAHGPATGALVAAGFVPPDVLMGQTLLLLARQPRPERDDREREQADDGGVAKVSPIAGGVWVREQVTFHRPIGVDEPLTVSGTSARRFVKRGRRYGTTTATTRGADGTIAVENCTTGLYGYRPDPALPDSEEGLAEAEVAVPTVDHAAVSANPSLEQLRAVRVGDRFGGDAVTVELALMVTRDGPRSDNPIHSDPEQARRAGLAAPIAGGSHVVAFALEPLHAAWGPQALLHGARLDVRWFTPTAAGDTIVPTATVTAIDGDAVEVELAVDGTDGSRKLRGNLMIPIGAIR